MSRRSLQRKRRPDFKVFPYKILWLINVGTTTKKSDSYTQPGQKEKIKTIFNKWFLEEANFLLDETVNKHNMRFWWKKPPENLHEKKSYGKKIAFWFTMSRYSFIGPIFFKETGNSGRYLQMLQNDFWPQHIANGLPLHTQWFMQDGARQHAANVLLDRLNTVFGPSFMSNDHPGRHNCGNFWPPLSSNRILATYFCGGFWKGISFHENNSMNLMWKECLCSCAEGLKKTCVTILLKIRAADYKMVAISSIYWHRNKKLPRACTKCVKHYL